MNALTVVVPLLIYRPFKVLALITSSAGVPMGGVVVDIPIGTDVTITATNGTCVVTRIISSPDCSVIDPCTNPTISLGGPVCASDGSPFYSVDYVVSSNVTGGWSNVGTITPNSIINIPSGTDLILGLEVSGCNTTIINIPSLNCPQCEKPTLTTGPTVCNATNDTYSVSFNSDADAASVTASAGTILGNTVTDIPFGTDVTITASNGLGCEVSQTITGLTNCPVDCEYPNLTVGKAVCQGNNTYSFTFSSNGSVTKTTAGIITGNTVTNIPIGTDVVISAENDNCINVLTVLSPANCLDFEIPTAFTPNGDGVNDYWEIPGLKELYPYNVVRIYNRWGNLLFESNGYDIPWNGKYNGEDLPVASYYFIIELNDEVQEAHTGTVTIMKKN
jgi:gliding motility-associated-like protein